MRGVVKAEGSARKCGMGPGLAILQSYPNSFTARLTVARCPTALLWEKVEALTVLIESFHQPSTVLLFHGNQLQLIYFH